MNPKFLIVRPNRWIKNQPEKLRDAIEFFDLLSEVLEEYEYEYEIIDNIDNDRDIRPPEFDPQTTICLAHHTYSDGPVKNLWHTKKSYIPGYMYIDRTGYSGWSELATNFDKHKGNITDLNESFAAEYQQRMASVVSKLNKSKHTQPKRGTFKCDSPYVFLPSQMHNDTVMKLARFKMFDMMKQVVAAFKDTEYKVVIKPHPVYKDKVPKQITDLDKHDHVIMTDASIYDVIEDAEAVIVTNSGVGFEAMIQGKHVFTTGECEYQTGTTQLFTKKDIANIPNRLNDLDPSYVTRLVYYMMNSYFIDAANKAKIKRKIDKIVNEFQNGNK